MNSRGQCLCDPVPLREAAQSLVQQLDLGGPASIQVGVLAEADPPAFVLMTTSALNIEQDMLLSQMLGLPVSGGSGVWAVTQDAAQRLIQEARRASPVHRSSRYAAR
jgi:hypothetical protein